MDPNLNGTSPMTISPIDPGVQDFVDEMACQRSRETAQKIDLIMKDLIVLEAWAKELIFLFGMHIEMDEYETLIEDIDSVEISSETTRHFVSNSNMRTVFNIKVEASQAYAGDRCLNFIEFKEDSAAILHTAFFSQPEVRTKEIQVCIPLFPNYCNAQVKAWAILGGLVYHRTFNAKTLTVNAVFNETGFGGVYFWANK